MIQSPRKLRFTRDRELARELRDLTVLIAGSDQNADRVAALFSAYQALASSAPTVLGEVFADPIFVGTIRSLIEDIAAPTSGGFSGNGSASVVYLLGGAALGAGYLEERPVQVRLPILTPFVPLSGTRLKLPVDGSSRRQPLIEAEVTAQRGFLVNGLPVTPVGLPEAADIPFLNAHPGLDEQALAPCRPVSVPILSRWSQPLSVAIGLVRASSAGELIQSFFFGVVEVLGEKNAHVSSTFAGFPGLVALSFTEDELMLAEALVHETDHLFLYELLRQAGGPGPSDDDGTRYYSPWRLDPRPASGLIFGVSAFVRVGCFLAEIRDRLNFRSAARAGERATHALLQSKQAIEILEGECGRMAYTAREIVNVKGKEADQALALLAREAEFDEWASVAGERMDRHYAEWKGAHEALGRSLTKNWRSRC